MSPVLAKLWLSWQIHPSVALGLAVSGGAYAAGIARLWRAAGKGRVVARWRAACFAAGIVVLAVALASPLDSLGESVFWAHMVQHLLLSLVAAPLLALGAPLVPLLWLLDAPRRRRLGGWWHRAAGAPALAGLLTIPLVAWVLQAAALWAWHLPAAYLAALGNEGIHTLEHLSFLSTGFLFWWVVLQPAGRRCMGYGMSVLYLVTAGMQSGLLGALLTFAGRPFYGAQSAGAGAWGLSPLEDQQLAGLIMWLPGGLVYVAAAGALFVRWLRADQPRRLSRLIVRVGSIAAVAAAVGLVTGCPFHKSGTTGTDGTTKTDSSSSMHPLGGGWVSKPRGLLDGLFDRSPGQNSGSSESEDHISRKDQQPLLNELRNAFGPGRQGYEEPMPQVRAPRAPRPTFHTPRASSKY